MLNKLSAQDEAKVEAMKNDAESGNVKQYIDDMNQYIAYHELDLPTIMDADAAIIDKHAIMDIAKDYPKNAMSKYIKTISKHPTVEFWYKDDNQFMPLNEANMKTILKAAVHYVIHHYNSHDDERNKNVNDPIGELKDEIKQ